MVLRQPQNTRTEKPLPYTTLFQSVENLGDSLPAALGDDMGGAAPDSVELTLGDPVGLADLAEPVAIGSQQGPFDGDPLGIGGIRPDIGRASCRERVCTYV